jgi:hypothetical protein
MVIKPENTLGTRTPVIFDHNTNIHSDIKLNQTKKYDFIMLKPVFNLKTYVRKKHIMFVMYIRHMKN